MIPELICYLKRLLSESTWLENAHTQHSYASCLISYILTLTYPPTDSNGNLILGHCFYGKSQSHSPCFCVTRMARAFSIYPYTQAPKGFFSFFFFFLLDSPLYDFHYVSGTCSLRLHLEQLMLCYCAPVCVQKNKPGGKMCFLPNLQVRSRMRLWVFKMAKRLKEQILCKNALWKKKGELKIDALTFCRLFINS